MSEDKKIEPTKQGTDASELSDQHLDEVAGGIGITLRPEPCRPPPPPPIGL